MAGLSTSPNSPDATSDEKAISSLKGLTVTGESRLKLSGRVREEIW
jgi:hypothetical protein